MNFADKQLQQREAKQTKEQIESEQASDRMMRKSRSLQAEHMHFHSPWGFGFSGFGWR